VLPRSRSGPEWIEWCEFALWEAGERAGWADSAFKLGFVSVLFGTVDYELRIYLGEESPEHRGEAYVAVARANRKRGLGSQR
jgi:hypothetical protein